MPVHGNRMKSYTKKYLQHFGYDVSDFIPCEACGGKATDIHHLVPRSRNMALLNDISNMVALCRPCHTKAETNFKFNNELKMVHQRNLLVNEKRVNAHG